MAADAHLGEGQLWVGQAPYKVVVIPPETRTLLGSTVDLLERFLDAGGAVIAVEPTPTLVEAQPSERLSKLLSRPGVTVVRDKAGLQAALEAATPRRVSLRNQQGQEAASLLYMQRKLDGQMAYFVVNGDRHNGYFIDLELEGSGRLEEWDLLTGEMCGHPAVARDGKLGFRACLGPAGSRLYVIDPQGQAEPGEAYPPAAAFRGFRQTTDASFIGPTCAFTRTDPNVLTLDMCRYRLGEGEWSEPMEVWRAQGEVRRALGMRQNYYNGLPQRYKWALEPHPQDGAAVSCASPLQSTRSQLDR